MVDMSNDTHVPDILLLVHQHPNLLDGELQGRGRQLRGARSVTGKPANVSSQDWGQQPWAGLTFTMVAAVLLPSARSAGGAAGGCDASLAAYNTTSTNVM